MKLPLKKKPAGIPDTDFDINEAFLHKRADSACASAVDSTLKVDNGATFQYTGQSIMGTLDAVESIRDKARAKRQVGSDKLKSIETQIKARK